MTIRRVDLAGFGAAPHARFFWGALPTKPPALLGQFKILLTLDLFPLPIIKRLLAFHLLHSILSLDRINTLHLAVKLRGLVGERLDFYFGRGCRKAHVTQLYAIISSSGGDLMASLSLY